MITNGKRTLEELRFIISQKSNYRKTCPEQKKEGLFMILTRVNENVSVLTSYSCPNN